MGSRQLQVLLGPQCEEHCPAQWLLRLCGHWSGHWLSSVSPGPKLCLQLESCQPLLCLSPSLCFFGPLPSDFCICYSKEFALGKVTRNLLVVRSGRCQHLTLPDLKQHSASLTSSPSSLLCFPGFHPHFLLPHREPTGVCFPASSFFQK